MLTYRITEHPGAGDGGADAYVSAETSTQAAEFARQFHGFVNPRAVSIDRGLVPEGAAVLTAIRRGAGKEAPDRVTSVLLTRPVLTIGLGVFAGLVAFAVFVAIVSVAAAIATGWTAPWGKR